MQSKAARTPNEIQKLVELGFEFVFQKDGLAYSLFLGKPIFYQAAYEELAE